MSAVAVGAYRAGQQTFFDQTFTMHTAGIIYENIPLMGFQSRRVIQLAMTVSAKLGNVGAIGFISLIKMRKNTVIAVTVRTIGCIGILLKIGLPMAALKIFLCNLGMAVGTVHSIGSLTRPVYLRSDIRMAFHTGYVAVG